MRLRLGHENENRVLRMRLLGRRRRWRRRRRKKRVRRGGRGTDNARLSHTYPEIWDFTVRGWLPLRHMKSPWKEFPDSKSVRNSFLLAYAIQLLTFCYSSWNTKTVGNDTQTKSNKQQQDPESIRHPSGVCQVEAPSPKHYFMC